MKTCALNDYIAATGGTITVHGRTYTVVEVRSGGDIGWGATFRSKRADYIALQTVPARLPQDPTFERWFLMIGRKAFHFAVRADEVRDLR